MKNIVRYILIIAVFPTMLTVASAQSDNNSDAHNVTITIPEVALVDIEPSTGNTISIGPTAPTEAGEGLDFTGATDNSLWLNYSSIVGSSSESSRNVSVMIASGAVPGGMLLKVAASADAGNGDGAVGVPGSEVTLTGTGQDIITGIGSCYTADGVNNGHQLTYTLVQDPNAGSYADIDFDESTTLTIMYTISDD